jgi:chorismate synthase
LRFLTAGESHGKCLAGIIDDYPSGVLIDINYLNYELKRRQKTFGRSRRMSIEDDRVEIISGIRKGRSIGSPISFIIKNKDWENWKEIMDINPEGPGSGKPVEKLLNPRPGHADLTGFLKYRSDDIRDIIERSSARETAARVCSGAFAKTVLKLLGINIISYVTKIGKKIFSEDIKITGKVLKEIERSEVRCPDKKISLQMKQEIKKAAKNKDSLGGSFKVIATGVPPGLGSYSQWDRRIDARIAAAFMSIPSVKGVEIGEGINQPSKTGSYFHDEIYYKKSDGFYRKTNRAGGIEGGMTNGEPVVITAYMKPIPTTGKGLHTINIKSKEDEVSLKERSDICAVPSASVVGESMLSIEILNSVQEKFGKDSITEILENYSSYKRYIEKV